MLHPKYAESSLFEWGVRGGGEAEGQDHSRVDGVYDAVVPEPRGRVVGVAFILVLFEDRGFEVFALLIGHLFVLAPQAFFLHGEEDVRGLLAAHHADAGVWPHPEEARRVGPAAHPVVAGPEGAADDHGKLWDAGVCHGHDQLGSVLRDTAGLVFFADHEARYVLQEEEWDATRAAKLYEVRALERTLGEENAVVGKDANGVAHDAREPAHQRLAVERLELVQPAAVYHPCDDLPHVVALPVVVGDDTVQFFRVVERLLGLIDGPGYRLLRVQFLDDLAHYREGVFVVLREVVCDAGAAGVYV